MRLRELLLGASLALVTATPARADDSREVARVHYARGLDLANRNAYAEALQEFNQAYIVSPEFAVLYNIGQCHVALGHPTEATEALTRYLRDGGERIPPARREAVKAQLELLAARRQSEPEPPATGQTPAQDDARDVARARVARGIELASHNRYAAALIEFGQAYATSPDFVTLYNIGQCHVALGHPLEAIEAFAKYLRDGGEQVPQGRRDLLGAQIAMLESRLAELTIKTVGPPAQIELDGHGVGPTAIAQPIRLAAGNHHVSLTPATGPVVDRIVTLAEAEHLVLTVRLPFLPAGWSPAVAARVAGYSAAAARAATASAIANESATVEKARATTSLQGGSGSSQGGSSH